MLTQPDDIERYTDDIHRALTDERWRSEATQGGLRVAEQYSWERCASETLDVYKKVVRSS